MDIECYTDSDDAYTQILEMLLWIADKKQTVDLLFSPDSKVQQASFAEAKEEKTDNGKLIERFVTITFVFNHKNKEIVLSISGVKDLTEAVHNSVFSISENNNGTYNVKVGSNTYKFYPS